MHKHKKQKHNKNTKQNYKRSKSNIWRIDELLMKNNENNEVFTEKILNTLEKYNLNNRQNNRKTL